MRKKKRWKWLFLLLLLLVPVGLFFAGRLYYTDARVFQENWNLPFPSSMKQEYDVQSEKGFQGDGVSYLVFQVQGAKPYFIDGMSEEPDSTVQKEVAENLKDLKAEAEWYPDFSQVQWKLISRDENFKRLYILYDPQKSLVYLLGIII